MSLFHQVHGGSAVVYSKGTFKQVDLYHYKGCVFAKNGSGYVRIKRVGASRDNNLGTSIPSLMVDSMFASLGGTGSGGDSGLLNALNSVSLGGGGGLATASQQGNNTNWESKIAGWGGEADSTNSSLLQQSRLGDYREEGG